MTILTDQRPGVSADDGYYGIGAGSSPFNSTFNDMSFGTFFPGFADSQVFIRFPGLAIDTGSTVTAATLTLRATGSPGAGQVRVKIRAVNQDNATAPSSSADGNARPVTTAGVDWDPAIWTVGQDFGAPDISTVIQEVVSRAGWASGNAIVLYLIEDGSASGAVNNAMTIDGSATNCARLTIAFTPPTSASNRMGGTGAIREARRKRPSRRRRKS